MDRINGAGHVNRRFVTEDAGANRPPTEITDVFLNSVQEEIVNVILAAGIALNPLAENQLVTAIAMLITAGAPVVPNATETVDGKVELATNAETITGTDTVRATHPAGVKAAIQSAITALVNSSPAALDTLNELAAALGNDANFATTMTNALALKAALAQVQTWTKAQRGAVVALADAATVAVDFSLANNFSLNIVGNRMLGAPTNMVAGQSGCITITQDATGSRTLAYNTAWKFAGGSVPALSTTPNAVDVLTYYVQPNGTTVFSSLAKGVV